MKTSIRKHHTGKSDLFSFRTRSMQRWVVALMVVGLCCGSCQKKSGSGGSFGGGLPKVHASSEVLNMEQEMFRRLNQDRGKNGRPPLKYDPRLADIGRYHSNDMKTHHFFEHESPTSGTLQDRLDKAGYLAVVGRENLAEAPNVQRAEDGLLKSPGHYANIMADDITHIGIGIIKGGVKAPENITITQVFAKPAEKVSASKAKAMILKAIESGRRENGLTMLKIHPKLESIAAKKIELMGNDIESGQLDNISQQVIDDISKDPKAEFQGVAVSATMLINVAEFKASGALIGSKGKYLGVATSEGTDTKGRPVIKVLMLIGH
jgi:uncharacterized protein YkwD